MDKRTAAALIAVSLLVVFGASSCAFFVAESLTSIQVNPSSASVGVGQTQQLTATGVNNDGSQSNLTNVAWSSSNTQVATVSTTGLVSGVTAGSATISATVSGLSGTSSITVGSSSGGAVQINPANQTVSSTQGAVQFAATLNGQDVTSLASFTSSNPAVAQFGGFSPGVATLVGMGTTTITATVTSNGTTNTGSTNLTVGP